MRLSCEGAVAVVASLQEGWSRDTETIQWCKGIRNVFKDLDSFNEKGGFKSIGAALDRRTVQIAPVQWVPSAKPVTAMASALVT